MEQHRRNPGSRRPVAGGPSSTQRVAEVTALLLVALLLLGVVAWRIWVGLGGWFGGSWS